MSAVAAPGPVPELSVVEPHEPPLRAGAELVAHARAAAAGGEGDVPVVATPSEGTWYDDVERWLPTLMALDRIEGDAAFADTRIGLMRRAAAPARRYLAARPHERALVAEALASCRLRQGPWRHLLDGDPGRELVLLGADAYDDVVDDLARRGALADVVTYAAPAGVVAELQRSGEVVAHHVAIDGDPIVSWSAFAAYAVEVLGLVATLTEGPAHAGVRSVSAHPREHLLAALLKLVHPSLHWTAVVRDGGADLAVEPDEVFQILAAGLVEAGFTGSELPESAHELTRLLVEHLADDVVRPRTDEPDLRLSVVLATHDGDAWLGRALACLGAQTLPTGAFELVVVQNGPPTRAAEIVDRFAAAHPGFQITYVHVDHAELSNARNVGLQAARGEYVTFIDDDDRMGPRYLEALLEVARPDAVGALLAAEAYGGPPVPRGWLSEAVLDGRRARDEIDAVLHSPWAKVVATDKARAVGFPTTVSFGKDTLFWMTLVARYDTPVLVGDLSMDAAYVWERRAGSITGSAPTFERIVWRQLDAARAIAAVEVGSDELARVRDHIVARFQLWASSWLRSRPRDLGRFVAVVHELGLASLDWEQVDPGLATAIGGRLGRVGAVI